MFFFQYKKEGNFKVTRPVNTNIFYQSKDIRFLAKDFIKILKNSKSIKKEDRPSRRVLMQSIYTIQQSIGAVLDALPENKTNQARKINGDRFERLIRIIINEIGINCTSGIMKVPVEVNGKELFQMSYQHDLLLKKPESEEIAVIGSVKTSSKDRIDKIFIDKFLYDKLTGTSIPHIAIFLNDVQRKKTRKENFYEVNSTFLSGRFKGYMIKLNPLDGVYYCDIRPNMISEKMLKKNIKTIDSLICDDIWRLL